MMKVFTHLGTHKTASTFMQHLFFPSLSGVKYCNCKKEYAEFMRYLLHADDFEFNPSYASKLLEAGGMLDPSRPHIFSDEMFYTPLFWSSYCYRVRGSERISQSFPSSHVIIVFRNQKDLLKSLYLMFVRNGGTATWNRFLQNHIPKGYLAYSSFVTALLNLFGKERVSVFFYEDFISNPEAYLNEWCDLFGVPHDSWDRSIMRKKINPSIAPSLIGVKRLTNRFVSSAAHPELLFPRTFGKTINSLLSVFSTPWLSRRGFTIDENNNYYKKIIDNCRDGNRKLARFTERELDKLNYPC